MAKQPKTYTAPHPVYVDRQYFKAGRPFTTAAEKGEDWEEIKTAEKRALDAQEPIDSGMPLNELDLASLKALAVSKNVNPQGLSKKDLIAAINAADEPKL